MRLRTTRRCAHSAHYAGGGDFRGGHAHSPGAHFREHRRAGRRCAGAGRQGDPCEIMNTLQQMFTECTGEQVVDVPFQFVEEVL